MPLNPCSRTPRALQSPPCTAGFTQAAGWCSPVEGGRRDVCTGPRNSAKCITRATKQRLCTTCYDWAVHYLYWSTSTPAAMAKILRQLRSLPPVYTEISHGAVEGVRVGISGMAPNTAVWFYRVGDTLIDTGSPRGASGVRKYLRKMRAQKQGVWQVVTTHHHEGE